jgi:sigma-B regulation protein RsbU (phosphoserine phosphatase)
MAEDRLKILLIEHDPGFAQTLGELLSHTHELGADLRSAANLAAGLSALTGSQFDVVVVDVSVPDGAGLANVGLIRAAAPELPVIVAGDADSEAVALEAVHAGAHDYLVKSQLTPSWLERSIRYSIERHRMDAALLAAEEKYHSVFDHLVEGIFQTSPDGHYLMANAALARIYGYETPGELMRDLTDISRRLYVEAGRREEFIRLMQENDVLSGFESEVFRKDGTRIWISENCRAVRDREGRLLYYEGTVEDVTQRRTAEDRLRTSQELYHSLVETLPQNIFRKDLQGRFTFANGHFCRILGHPMEEIVGKTDYDFFPPELASQYQSDDQQVMETGQPHEQVEEHIPPNGSKIYVQVVKSPIRGSDGRIVGLQGIFWDITQQREAQEKIRKAHALLAESREELHRKNVQMEDELKMARDIQLLMLPQQYPTFPGSAAPADSAFRFTHRYLPTGTVGGDFFSITPLSDREAAVFICDVAGHGVRSALVTAMVRALVEEVRPDALNPGRFLTRLNADLYGILKHAGSPLLTTAFYLVANCETGEMRYANAGHPKPVHLRRSEGRVELLGSPGGKGQPALGLIENASYQTAQIQLSTDDLVMLYTDGLYEVQGPQNELYTQEFLLAEVRHRVQQTAAQLFDEIIATIQRFSCDAGFSDDVCLVGIEFARRVSASEGSPAPL